MGVKRYVHLGRKVLLTCEVTLWNSLLQGVMDAQSQSIPAPSTTNTTPQPRTHTRHHLMIRWIGSSLIQEIHRLSAQLHPLPFEPNIAHARYILLALSPVVLEEQIERSDGVEQRAFDGYFLDVVALC